MRFSLNGKIEFHVQHGKGTDTRANSEITAQILCTYIYICQKYKYIAFSSMPNRGHWRTQAYRPVDNVSKVFGKSCIHNGQQCLYLSEYTRFLLFSPPIWGLCKCLCHLLWQPMHWVMNEQTDLILSSSKWQYNKSI